MTNFEKLAAFVGLVLITFFLPLFLGNYLFKMSELYNLPFNLKYMEWVGIVYLVELVLVVFRKRNFKDDESTDDIIKKAYKNFFFIVTSILAIFYMSKLTYYIFA